MQHCLLCSSHVGMNFENACCVLLVFHVPSKALPEVFLLLQGVSLDDSNVTFAIHSCVNLCHKKTLEGKNKRKRSRILKTHYTATDT